MQTKKPQLDLVTIITLLVAFATIFFQIFPPKTPIDQVKSVIYFLAILGYIGILYFINRKNVYFKCFVLVKNTQTVQ